MAAGALTRLAGWPARLHRELEAVRSAPLEPGRDCWIFAADAVRAVTGTDIAHALRGRYACLAEGMELVRAHGGATRVLARALGRPLPARLARRGDVVACRTAGGTALGVSVGHLAAFRAPVGLALLPLADCVACWRVG